eukprot:m.236824 g.236824  ORF g.236824 m.236824 type:complete len:546 (-) comp13036_c0_seq1:293-1930(-)
MAQAQQLTPQQRRLYSAFTMSRAPQIGFGFSVMGGEDVGPGKPIVPVFITKVKPNSPAEQVGLPLNSILVGVNDLSLESLSHKDVVAIIKAAPDTSTLYVKVPAKNTFVPNRASIASLNLLPTDFDKVEALFAFEATRPDELALDKGDFIHVTHKGADGWCLGQNQRTQQIGLFPGNFVARVRPAPLNRENIYQTLPEERSGSPVSRREVVYASLDLGSDPTPSEPEEPAPAPELPARQSMGTVLAPVQADESPYSQVARPIYAQPIRSRRGTGTDMAAAPSSEPLPMYAMATHAEPPPMLMISEHGNDPQLLLRAADDIYSRLEDVGGAGSDAPPIPERKYDADALAPILNSSLSASRGSRLDDPNYEKLPSMKVSTDQGDSDDEHSGSIMFNTQTTTYDVIPTFGKEGAYDELPASKSNYVDVKLLVAADSPSVPPRQSASGPASTPSAAEASPAAAASLSPPTPAAVKEQKRREKQRKADEAKAKKDAEKAAALERKAAAAAAKARADQEKKEAKAAEKEAKAAAEREKKERKASEKEAKRK